MFLIHGKKRVIEKDIERWLLILNRKHTTIVGLVYLLGFYPEFRNLFYKRIGPIGHLLGIFCPKMSTLYIVTEDIGPGLFIQHGFATIISAKSIGENCWVNQQVTIGYGIGGSCPVIGDNVDIKAGAKIFGGIKIGSNSIIGANSVVSKDVPSDCTVAGVPASIIRLNGVKVKQALI
ncbi:MAG: serine acetyltransferase [Pedobacter sp.]|nr:MAG: serine acetyltransferase [Pedobacter sp.]